MVVVWNKYQGSMGNDIEYSLNDCLYEGCLKTFQNKHKNYANWKN